ncbi:3-oxoacyl-ACP synthase [Chryseobacterium sp. Leaf180]|uniref:3-oxoacyl-ACP synthase III family protein n=1 Tax=Chryseobacterium sp. Leaf180 TaxID=1736289 RepID=UPI0006FC1C65|nr:ketoacyl-ACP synthase III [Chryseobacterium sp. Leaf180]KQR94881.1 3-oxoacyl-ACP synthase [Chryseobacterium sp. Leaf180]
MNVKIVGSGSCIPTNVITNEYFSNHIFLNEDGSEIKAPETIIRKFKEITGIDERRYADENHVTSDLAFAAAEKAVKSSGIDPETLDYIIVAHNYGDVKKGNIQSDTVPSIATRVKSRLQIKNPSCVGYDLLFGCPGWLEGMIHANAFIKAGIAKKCLVVGAETLSRVTDQSDRDSMIYADGAGATIVEATDDEGGILAHETATYATEEAEFLFFGTSYDTNAASDTRYIKMKGRKIYEFALTKVPLAMKICLEKANVPIEKLSKILIHQANEKMDEAIVERFYSLYDLTPPKDIMPMSIHKLGNSSVATIPTLYDMIMNNEMGDHAFEKGDIVLFASVGAGMNINAIAYQF